jgi:Family of unknown function (DUF5677)
MNSPDPTERLWEITGRFVRNARTDLELRWNALPRDLGLRELHEVTGSLLSRQVTLATQLASAPNAWNGHAAPLYLRAMADVYISLAWILKEPDARAHDFVLFGLGEEKLRLEHRKKEFEKAGGAVEQEGYIQAIEAWIEQQRVLHLVEVNLGSWSGRSTRKMAEEADCLDFYNYVYAPFSSCVHSMWGHVARYNLVECQNPLHQYHRVPISGSSPMDVNYLYLAGKCLKKTIRLFDQSFSLDIEPPTAFDLLNEDIDVFVREEEANGEESPIEVQTDEPDGET